MKITVSLHTSSPGTPDTLGRAVTLTFVFVTCMINIKQMEHNIKKHFKIFLKVQIISLLLKIQLKYLIFKPVVLDHRAMLPLRKSRQRLRLSPFLVKEAMVPS